MKPAAIYENESSTQTRITTAGLLVLAGVVGTLLLIVPVADTRIWDPAITNLFLLLAFTAIHETGRAQTDLLRPIHWINGIFLVLFVGHPVALVLTGLLDRAYRNRFDLRESYPTALWLGMLAITALNVAYISSRSWRRASLADASVVVRKFDVVLAARVASVCGVIAVCAALYLEQTGFYAYAEGASAGAGRTAYVYFVPFIAVPACCLLVLCVSRGGGASAKLALISILTASVGIQLYAGARRSVFILVAAPLATYLVDRRVRISRALIATLLPIALFVFAAVGDANGFRSDLFSSLKAALSDPGRVILNFMTGADTEMVDGFALQLQSMERIGFHPVSTIVSVLSHPVPRVFWPGKPVTADVALNNYHFGWGIHQAGVAYSFLGEGYYAAGIVGVALLAAILGWFYGYVERSLLSNRSEWNIMFFAIALAMVPTVVRGILAYNLAIASFLLAPIFFVFVLAPKTRTPVP
ncbi:hypothetical protein MPNTM1_05601 [Mycolicibacterium parafortuitum]|uniref:O-antigen polymerase n=1 Tax=Mycolicibacterium parafortuitum TaxID=39692 RepID=UPI0032C4A7F8